jgi:hypothetical protein
VVAPTGGAKTSNPAGNASPATGAGAGKSGSAADNNWRASSTS